MLQSKAFKTLLQSEFALPDSSHCGWFFDACDSNDFRSTVRSFCALGGAAFKLLAEVVEHQEVTRGSISKTTFDVESLGLIIVREGDKFVQENHRLSSSLLGEDVLLAVEQLLDTLAPSNGANT